MAARRRVAGLATGLLLLAAAVPARAAPIAFTARLSLQFGSLPAITTTGTALGDSGGAGGNFSMPGSVFSLAGTVPLSPPLLIIDGFGVGAPGQVFGSLPLAPGTNKALAWNGASGAMPLDASLYLMRNLLATTTPTSVAAAIPLGVVGVGGVQKFSILGGLIMGSVQAAPYQLGMVTLMGNLNGGGSTLVGTGFDNRTVGGVGVLQLVSPAMVSLGGPTAFPVLAIFTIVPEPSTVALVGVGLAALAALRRSASTDPDEPRGRDPARDRRRRW